MKIPSHFLGLAALVCAVCIPVSAVDDCVPIPSGLSGWWSGDGNAEDLSGSYNLANLSAISYGAGKVGSAFQYGEMGRIKFGPSPSLNVRSLTFAAWINPANEEYMPIFQYQKDNDFMGALLWAGTVPGGVKGTLYSNLRENHFKNAVIEVPGVIVTNEWTFVAVTYDQGSGIQRLYVNGEIVKEANIGFLNPNTGGPLYIGHVPPTSRDLINNRSFIGSIDEPQVYNRALSTNELNEIYLAGSDGVCKPAMDASIALQQATATFSQSNGDFSVAYAIDGNASDNLGWGIDPVTGPQTAAFETATDVGFAG